MTTGASPAPPSGGGQARSTGEVFDLGYQHYGGARRGRAGAVSAVFFEGVRTALGIGRGVTPKLVLGLFVLLAMAPATFIVVVAGFASSLGAGPGDIELPGHADYYGFSYFIMLLFAAVVAPALLCPDRRNSVMVMYLVRPLTSTDYVFARWAAFLSIALVFVYLPQLVLLISFVLSADNPRVYLQENWLDIPRVLGAGLGIAVLMTSIAMAVASLTDRRAFASAGVIGLVILASAVGGVGQALLNGAAADYATLLIIPHISEQLVRWTFGQLTFLDVPEWAALGWVLALVAGAVALMWLRYRALHS